MAPYEFTNGQVLRAQLGRKSRKSESLALLIIASDLPGDPWFQRDQKVYRCGTLGPQKPWSKRAGKEGKFMAVRSFEQPSTQSWLLTQVIPLLSQDDATLAVSAWTLEDSWANSNFHGSILNEREILDETVPGVDGARIFEQETQTPAGHGFNRLAMAFVGPIVMFAGVSRADRPWTANEFDSVVTAQVAKLSIG